MKKIFKSSVLAFALLTFFATPTQVDAVDINLTVRDGTNIIFSGAVPLPTGITSLSDATGASRVIDNNSVLAVLGRADQASSDFFISNLTYFDSFNSLYLKCITGTTEEKCDNWQYAVNNLYPSVGMDQNILSGGENVYIYFGPQNRLVLSLESLNTSDILIVTAQKYDYQNNAWITRTGVTVGLTQPDPNNPWSPIEIRTNVVDANGQATFSSLPVGSYNVGIKEDFYFPTEVLTVITAAPTGSASCCAAVSDSTLTFAIKPVFDIPKAFEFIIAQQKENGSFGQDLYTDWTALALASGNYQNQTIKLVKYFGESRMKSALLTDYERRAMALMALGLNPYNTNGENYIKKITDSFDGKQFGDVNEDNDDIFALIVLQNAGFTWTEKIINDSINFVLSRQKENGSWDESVDMTGAGIGALVFLNQAEQIRPDDLRLEQVKNALAKAKEFLKQNQKETGGWDNISSTAWAVEGILALSEKPEDWIKNKNTPFDYLAVNQDIDDGIKDLSAEKESKNIQNKIWENAYAVTALSGKTWNQIMQKFEKPQAPIMVTVPVEITKKQKIKQAEAKKIYAVQNIAAPIIAINDAPIKEKMPEPVKKKSWLRNLFEMKFGHFLLDFLFQ